MKYSFSGKAQKIADTVGKPLTVRPDSTGNSIGTDSTYTNSIVDILQNVKEVAKRMKFSDVEKKS